MVKNEKHIKPGYHLTEVGIIPVDWQVGSLKNNLKSSPRYGIGAAAVDYSFQLPKYLRITDISDDGYYLPEKMVSVNHTFAENYYLADGDIVVARTGASVGKSYLYNKRDGALVFAGFLICLKTDEEKLIPQFLKNYLQTPTYWNWVKVTSMRSGQPGINGNEYASLNIPLPSKPEQYAIAQVLSDTDSLISSLDELIEKKKAIKQGAMQELLTGKKRLPGFSGKWELRKLGELADITGGGTPSSFNNSYWNGSINWFTPTEIGKFKYTYKSIRKISEIGFKNSSAKLLPVGTILLTSRAGIGDISILMEPGCTNQGFQSFVPNGSIDNEYLYYTLATMKNIFLQNASGSTFLEISPNKLRVIDILIPSTRSEQSAIAQFLSDMDSEISDLEMKRDKYKHIKHGMMSELLTGNIRLLGMK